LPIGVSVQKWGIRTINVVRNLGEETVGPIGYALVVVTANQQPNMINWLMVALNVDQTTDRIDRREKREYRLPGQEKPIREGGGGLGRVGWGNLPNYAWQMGRNNRPWRGVCSFGAKKE